MYDKLFKKYIPKNPEPIMEWARVCLKEADRLYIHGVRTISVKSAPSDRDKIAIYLKAEAAYQDMEASVGQEYWGLFQRDLERFYRLINHWDLRISDFVDEEAQKILPKTTAKTRLKELIDRDPYWMTNQIKDDLMELINKRDPQKKG